MKSLGDEDKQITSHAHERNANLSAMRAGPFDHAAFIEFDSTGRKRIGRMG